MVSSLKLPAHAYPSRQRKPFFRIAALSIILTFLPLQEARMPDKTATKPDSQMQCADSVKSAPWWHNKATAVLFPMCRNCHGGETPNFEMSLR